jgi:hypothetical protein
MVPTEIGDLPSDLWRLIGEQPPAENRQESDTQTGKQPDQVRPVSSASQSVQTSPIHIGSGNEARQRSGDPGIESDVSSGLHNAEAIQRSLADEPSQNIIAPEPEKKPASTTEIKPDKIVGDSPQTSRQTKDLLHRWN